MKVHKNAKIEAACSTDATRPALSEPYLDLTNGKPVLVATNGRILASIPVEVSEHDVTGYVCAEALKIARKAAKSSQPAEVGCVAGLALADGRPLPRNGQAAAQNYPANWRQVVPADFKAPIAVIRLDARELWQLAQAMGTESVAITVEDPSGVAHVAPFGRGAVVDGARGVIKLMPDPADKGPKASDVKPTA
jgi:hypothetical protein